MAVYADSFQRTGFQCALNWYRCQVSQTLAADMQMFHGRKIEVPACFIAGAQDWGIQQRPGGLKAMAERACTDWRGTHLIEGAGHWVQQEQPEGTVRHLLEFVRG